MITIDYEQKSGKFVIKCPYNMNDVVMGLPDRRFRKASKSWAAPALRRNIEYMKKHLNNPQMFSKEAYEIYSSRVKESCGNKKEVEGFPAWYEFKNPPMKHQAKTMDKAYSLDSFALFFEQGLGKTFTAINLAAAWRMAGAIEAVVVICPSSIKLVWEDELISHCPIPTQTHALMAGKYKKADRFIEEKTDFQWFIMGIEALSQGGAIKYLEKFLDSRRCLFIIDESSGIKNPDKTRTDRCISAGRLATKRLILSGTSVTQGIENLYTQYKFLDPDILGYDSFYTFRNQYCITMSMEVAENRWIQKIVGYKNEDELIQLIGPYTSRVEKADALDLPEKVDQNRYVEMNPTQKRIYEEMYHEMYMEMSGVEYEVTSTLEKTLRLQQITGGFYPHDDGESIVPVPIPGKNPKLAELMLLMDEMSGKIVVWCLYKCEIRLIAETLEKADIRFVEFHGDKDDVEKKYAVHAFRKDPEVKVFLATKAASRGLTLIESSNSVYYSFGHSLEDYDQSKDRIHRIGQHDPCTYVHLVASRTDKEIIRSLRDKKSVATMVYESMKAYDK